MLSVVPFRDSHHKYNQMKKLLGEGFVKDNHHPGQGFYKPISPPSSHKGTTSAVKLHGNNWSPHRHPTEQFLNNHKKEIYGKKWQGLVYLTPLYGVSSQSQAYSSSFWCFTGDDCMSSCLLRISSPTSNLNKSSTSL